MNIWQSVKRRQNHIGLLFAWPMFLLSHFFPLFVQEIWGKINSIVPFQSPMGKSKLNKLIHVFKFFSLIAF